MEFLRNGCWTNRQNPCMYFVPGLGLNSKETPPPWHATVYKHPCINIFPLIAGPKLTVDQFLKKLPSSVVKQGKIIDIRGSVGQSLQGGTTQPNKVHVVETEAVQEMKSRLVISSLIHLISIDHKF